MHIGAFEFRPGLLPTLAVALLLPLLLGLGLWQLDRAEQKRELLQVREQRVAAAPLDLNRLRPPRAEALYRRATATGRYDAEHQLLLDNQVRDGRPGYRVLTPLRLRGEEGKAILVDRGWVPAPMQRSRLPEPPADEDLQTVRGIVDRGPSPGLRLGETYTGDGSWPRRVQYVDFDYFGRALPYELPTYLLRVTENGDGPRPSEPAGLVDMPPSRHVGYAVQWFALAAALLTIYLVVNTRRRND